MKVVATKNAPGAIGPYSQAFVTNGFVFTSGQIPVNPETGEVPEGIEAQAEQSCKNVGALLEAAGSGFDKVLKTATLKSDNFFGDVRKKIVQRGSFYENR